jgi:hypothetical protein
MNKTESLGKAKTKRRKDTMQNFDDYQIANVENDLVDKIRDFEDQLKSSAGEEVVLIAYQKKS